MEVRRPSKRQGRQLEVLIRWVGTEWEDTWQPVRKATLTRELYIQARRMERVRYGETSGTQEAVRLIPAVARRSARFRAEAWRKRKYVVTDGDEQRVEGRGKRRQVVEDGSASDEADEGAEGREESDGMTGEGDSD